MSEFIKTNVDNGVLEIILSRPERKNAITAEMYEALAAAFEGAERDPAIGVIVILGGDSVFTAGNDLVDFQTNPPTGSDSPPFVFMRAMVRSTKVVVAGVIGSAVGIGTTLLLHCDLVVAGSSASFVVPFVNLGLVPEFASSRLLPAMLGRQRAARHFLLGDPFDADTALACGMVSQVVDDEQVNALARTYARRLMEKPPHALARTRAMIIPDTQEIEAIIGHEGAIFAEALNGSEFAEAATAFFEKRAPRFIRPAKG
ncbi:enoyl-CoA hydratase [Sphingobium sp. AN641]|uniref:enoyl-CoA hydratase n=1 Tax=Sphingobium sp. AN641 TaxID=3133443 RepID=UPI0030C23C04